VFRFKILSLDEAAIADVEGSFSESVAVEILGFDGGNVSGISGYFGGGIGVVDGLELIIYLFG
jgi:hypothetical protein